MNAIASLPTDTVPSGHQNLAKCKPATDTTAEFQSLLSPPPPPAKSFFTSSELKARRLKPVVFQKYQPDWILGILLLCFVLLAWVQVFYRRRLRQILMSPYSKRFLSQLVRDGDLFSERLSIALGILYLITTSLFIYEVRVLVFEKDTVTFINGFPFFALISLCVLCFWALKIALINFLSFVFKTRQTSREYLLNILIFNILTGIFLLPVLVLTIYLKGLTFLWICTFIFALFFLFRLIRGFLIGISIRKFSFLFLFVYLCSLEIIPLVVILKVVLNYY
jgi:hypothetical protein